MKLSFTVRKRSCGKVMFLHLSVILSTGGGVCPSACWDTPHGQTPPWADTPWANVTNADRQLLHCCLQPSDELVLFQPCLSKHTLMKHQTKQGSEMFVFTEIFMGGPSDFIILLGSEMFIES